MAAARQAPRTAGRDRTLAAGPDTIATVHPASIVRLQDPAERDAAMEALVGDPRSAAELVAA
jgi:hypothetical protein